MRRVGRELRRWRERIGITNAEAARRARWSPGKLSKIENAQQPIQGVDVLALGIVYDIKEKERNRLFTASLTALDRGWWHEYDEGTLVSVAQDFVELESEAALLQTFKPDLIPGLLQTERYAAELGRVAIPMASEESIRQRAQARATRQARLVDANPIKLEVVVWEAALRQNVGGATVMAAQLDRVRERAELPNIDIQVLPLGCGALPGLGASFQILSFDQDYYETVAYVENLTQGLYVEEPADVEVYTLNFAALREAALDQNRSLALIKEIADDL
ncbi:helix-turn-helix domain-containing protein [Actinokineospora sp.]|uniref:helix-turn-helix domain-containing protein n=1 Tax=Actinokineospora sp. TaxID=1872133 RepID=UPI004037FB64